MRIFAIAVTLVVSSLVFAMYVGASPERRYADSSCQYRMIYGQERGQQAGLLTLGGSRLRVATSGRHFSDILAERKSDTLPIYNLSHSIYALEKEYFMLRDFVQRHSLKAALVMIEPRKADFGKIHPDSATIARLTDIPVAVRNLWPEDRMQSLVAARDIVAQHLKFTQKVGKPHKETSLLDCDRLDFRLSIDGLDKAEVKYRQAIGQHLDWDLSSELAGGFLRWMDAFRGLEQEHDFELFFLLMTGFSEPLPSPAFEGTFEDVTGHKLITLDQDIHARLAEMGRRDSSHINEMGRDMFLPWLIEKIDDKCDRQDGCF